MVKLNGIAYIAGVAAIVGGIVVATPAQAEMVTVESPHGIVSKVPANSMPACEEEDFSSPVPCVWNSKVRGNFDGQSYVVLGIGEAQQIIQVTPTVASQLDM